MNFLGSVVVGIAFVIVVVAYFLAIKNTINPGEEAPDHIKRCILDDDH